MFCALVLIPEVVFALDNDHPYLVTVLPISFKLRPQGSARANNGLLRYVLYGIFL